MNPSSRTDHKLKKHGFLWSMFFLFSILLLLGYLLCIKLTFSLVDDVTSHKLSFDEAPSSITSNRTEEIVAGENQLYPNDYRPDTSASVNGSESELNIAEKLTFSQSQVIPVESVQVYPQNLSKKQPRYNSEEQATQTRVIQGEVIVKSVPSQKSVIDKSNRHVEQAEIQDTLRLAKQQSISTWAGNSISCGQPLSIPYQESLASQDLFIISQLKYGKLIMSDELFAYQEEGKQYLPMQLLAELLMLPVQFDADTRSLSGWYLSPEKTIDVSNNLMMFWGNGNDCSIKNTRVFYDDWDLYVESRVIEQMFGLKIVFEPSRQGFSILESATIPLSQLQERKRRYELFTAQQEQNNKLKIKEIKREDAMIGDLAMSLDLGIVSQQKLDIKKSQVEGFIQARTDIGGHNVYVGYSWSETDEVINAYIEKTLADSWVKHYRIGSIESHSMPLISESSAGVGVRVTAGEGFTDDFRYITVEGEVEPDWDVELYRNNSLISIQRVGSNANYRFTQVPYYMGLNQYQLRFFGPNGETRTESFSKMLDSSVLDKGSLGFSYGSMLREQDDLQQHYLNVNWAVTDRLTTGVSIVKQEIAEDDWLTIPKVSINFLGGKNLLQLNYADTGDGFATGVIVQGSGGDIDWLADWEFFDDFSSWENLDDRLKQQAQLNLNGSFAMSDLSWSLSGNWKEHTLGSDFLQFNAMLSGQYHRLSYSNELRWQSSLYENRIYNRIAASGRVHDWYLRSYLDLAVAPELEVNQWVLNANSSISERLNYQVELNYHPQNDDPFSVRNSIAYLFDHSALRLVIDNHSDGDWFAQLRWNSSLLWQPETNLWLLDRLSHLNTGAVKIIAFQDDNADGVFDDNELAVSGLSFSGHSQSDNTTDHKGELLITHLQTTRPQRLLLKESSLSDPFLVPSTIAITVNPHPGNIQEILYPVLYTAELEGNVVSRVGSKLLPAMGMLVTLRNEALNLEYKTRVEYDGVFIFDRVIPGRYQIFIEDKLTLELILKPGDYLELEKITLD
ncbi:carboxypeptidase regulatory-like domain-containing protein [Shewanella sp. YLB-07]|nr:carboxypeptidase regulatory-like domain-containing protein [Shewanella sp. YLB-07]